MKRILTITALVITVAAVSGCDFFRMVAGRPTSSEFRQKKEKVEATTCCGDCASCADREACPHHGGCPGHACASSEADAIVEAALPVPVNAVSPQRAVFNHKYYILVGTFVQKENADRMYKAVSSKGYEAERIQFPGGRTAICICPSDNLADIVEPLGRVLKEGFCPKDVCILKQE